MNKLMIILIGILVFLPGCTYAVRYDGPYTGKIIDADTGQPIEGVVILGTWYTAQFSPAGATHNFYDAEEAVTDKNGEFSISGKGVRILSNLEPMNILIFKVGYEYLDVPWVSLKKDILLKDKIKWEGDKAIIPLKKLTMEDRKKQGSPPAPPSEAPKGKIKLMVEEINKDRAERGLGPIDVGR